MEDTDEITRYVTSQKKVTYLVTCVSFSPIPEIADTLYRYSQCAPSPLKARIIHARYCTVGHEVDPGVF